MIARVLIFALLAAPAWADLNEVVLEQVRQMPKGGGYSIDHAANTRLASTVTVGEEVRIAAEKAAPAYCSGATYLVFLKTLASLQKSGALSLDRVTWEALTPLPRQDGEGLWGRWNANGPGTARLFAELKLGKNFTDFAAARPGDFMKIFWTDAVGKKETGHSVVFLGLETVDGVESVRYWSANRGMGFGAKTVPRTKIARAIFSRLEHPEKISEWTKLSPRDAYLGSLLTKESSFAEAARLSGINP